MSLMPSLCAALERVGGERLVMRAGERPHVLAGERRHDVASAVLSVNAVDALAEQILSSGAREMLATTGSVSESVVSPLFSSPLTARAERTGDDFCIELVVAAQPHAPADDDAESSIDSLADAEPLEAASLVEADSLVTSGGAETLADAPSFADPVLAADDEPESGPSTLTLADLAASPVAEPDRETPELLEPPVPDLMEPAAPAEAPDPEPRLELQDVGPTPAFQPDVTVITRVQEPVRPSASSIPMTQDLFKWISHAAELGATTLYLRAGSPAAARIDDRIQPISEDEVDAVVIEEAAGAFSRAGDGIWEPRSDGEWVREDDALGYVTCRLFSDVHGTGLIVQLRPSTSLRLLHKHIPRQVRSACEGNGLVVVAASSEGDVDALAAALADWSGRYRGGYLISLQRRSRSKGEMAGAFVSQRTVTGSEKEFATAIRRAAQEGPDILLVTGPQSEQALQAAVLAAAGGRLVIVGVVAPTAVEALRLLGGSDMHVRRALAASFRAAIGYRSLRRIGGGRTLVQDVVIPSGAITALLESGDFDSLSRTLRDGTPGVRSVDEALARAVRRRHISLREAAAQSMDRRHLVSLVRARTRNRTNESAPAGAPRGQAREFGPRNRMAAVGGRSRG